MPETKDIIKASKSGDSAAVRGLLDQDSSILNARDADGSTPLHYASWKGHAQIVTLLLARGADPNLFSENQHYGGTPLHAAAHGNQREIVELLLAHGANAAAVSCNGRTPLEETEIHKATAAARVLQASLAKPD